MVRSSYLFSAINSFPLGAGKESAMYYRNIAAFLLFQLDEGRGSKKTDYMILWYILNA